MFDSFGEKGGRDFYIDDHAYVPSRFEFYHLDGEVGPKRYYGIEMEVQTPNGRRETAYDLLSVLNKHAFLAYAKYDGSVDDGFELNTHPMTLPFLQALPHLSEVFKIAGASTNSSCGLHIHMDRGNFRNTKAIDLFIENIMAIRMFMLHLSKRTRFSAVDRYANMGNSVELLNGVDKTAREHCKKHKNLKRNADPKLVSDGVYHFKRRVENEIGRYAGINLSSHNTVEIRFLQGTIRWGLILHYVELFDRMTVLANEGVRIKSAYDLLRLTDGELHYWLVREYDKLVALVEKVEILKARGQLFVDYHGNMYYRVLPSKAKLYDRVLEGTSLNGDLNDHDHLHRTWRIVGNRELGMVQRSSWIILRRIPTVALVEPMSERALAKVVRRKFRHNLLTPDYSEEWELVEDDVRPLRLDPVTSHIIQTESDTYDPAREAIQAMNARTSLRAEQDGVDFNALLNDIRVSMGLEEQRDD